MASAPPGLRRASLLSAEDCDELIAAVADRLGTASPPGPRRRRTGPVDGGGGRVRLRVVAHPRARRAAARPDRPGARSGLPRGRGGRVPCLEASWPDVDSTTSCCLRSWSPSSTAWCSACPRRSAYRCLPTAPGRRSGPCTPGPSSRSRSTSTSRRHSQASVLYDGFVQSTLLVVIGFGLWRLKAWPWLGALALFYAGTSVTNMYFYFMQTFLGPDRPPHLGTYLPLNIPWAVLPHPGRVPVLAESDAEDSTVTNLSQREQQALDSYRAYVAQRELCVRAVLRGRRSPTGSPPTPSSSTRVGRVVGRDEIATFFDMSMKGLTAGRSPRSGPSSRATDSCRSGGTACPTSPVRAIARRPPSRSSTTPVTALRLRARRLNITEVIESSRSGWRPGPGATFPTEPPTATSRRRGSRRPDAVFAAWYMGPTAMRLLALRGRGISTKSEFVTARSTRCGLSGAAYNRFGSRACAASPVRVVHGTSRRDLTRSASTSACDA